MCNTLITYVSLLCGMVWCYAIVDITKINYPWPFLSKWNYPNFSILLSIIEISYLIILKLIILELHVKRKLVSTRFKMNKVININISFFILHHPWLHFLSWECTKNISDNYFCWWFWEFLRQQRNGITPMWRWSVFMKNDS